MNNKGRHKKSYIVISTGDIIISMKLSFFEINLTVYEQMILRNLCSRYMYSSVSL